MWIVKLALRRPYTFVVAALLLVLITPFILLRTPTDIFPAINIPVVSIIWQYTGLDAPQLEHRITYTHERILTVTVNNIQHIESTSYNGIGVVKVFLQPGASVDSAVAQITASAQTVLRAMPPGHAAAVDHPIQRLVRADLAVQLQQPENVGTGTVRRDRQPGARRHVQRARRDDSLALRRQNPRGFGGPEPARAQGEKSRWPQDVVNAVNAQNIILPSGTTKIGPTEYDVAVDANPRPDRRVEPSAHQGRQRGDDLPERRGAGP